MKRRTITSLLAFALAAAAPAWAQAKKPVRTGIIPASPAAQPIVVNTTGLPTTNPASPVPAGAPSPGYAPSAAIAQITWYPTIVLSDGRVFANFGTGRGYEQVLRQCPQLSGALPPNATIAPCFTVDSYGTFRVMQRR
jgi:hypothetical protein